MSIESMMPSDHLILCHPFPFLPSVFPNIKVFFNESALCTRWPNGASASASVLPMKIQGWFPLGWTGLITLLFKKLSRVFSSIFAYIKIYIYILYIYVYFINYTHTHTYTLVMFLWRALIQPQSRVYILLTTPKTFFLISMREEDQSANKNIPSWLKHYTERVPISKTMSM